MLTTVRRICGRIMHSQTALRSQWDKGWKNNSQFVSPSICRPTVCKMLNKMVYLYEIFKTVQYPFPIKIKKGNEHYGFHIENNKS